MAGAMLPDLNRLKWVVSPETAESVLGLSVSWRPMHSIGGVTIAICIGALLVRPQYRRAVAILLTVGALSHFALDLLLVPPAGSYRYLWPITSADIVLPASTVVETDGRTGRRLSDRDPSDERSRPERCVSNVSRRLLDARRRVSRKQETDSSPVSVGRERVSQSCTWGVSHAGQTTATLSLYVPRSSVPAVHCGHEFPSRRDRSVSSSDRMSSTPFISWGTVTSQMGKLFGGGTLRSCDYMHWSVREGQPLSGVTSDRAPLGQTSDRAPIRGWPSTDTPPLIGSM